MDTEFDPAKDVENRRAHGVSLALGGSVLRGAVGEAENARRDYGEPRFRVFGYVEGRLFACTYTSAAGYTGSSRSTRSGRRR